MRINLFILSVFALFWPAACCLCQCTDGCTTTLSLSPGSSTIQNHTFTGPHQTLCIVVSGGGTATISGGTINFSNSSNAVLCTGPGVVVAPGVTFSNLHNQTTLNNYGTLQNSLTFNNSQNVLNNYGTISGPVTLNHNNATINNLSGGAFNSSSFSFNNGNFVNQTGASVNLPGSLTINGNFSGGGTVSVGGNLTTNSGTVSIGGNVAVTGNITTNTAVSFGSSVSAGGSFTTNSGAVTVGGSLSAGNNITLNTSLTVSSGLSVTGNLTVNSGTTQVAGATSVSGNGTFNSSSTFSGGAVFGGNIRVNAGTTSFPGGASVAGNLVNSATINFAGSVSATGSITNTGTITSSSSNCKSLCATSISNTGTISSTAGPQMVLCVAPSGGGQINLSTVSTPVSAPTGLSVLWSGGVLSGSFTHASPLPGGYLVLVKTGSAFTSDDLPVNYSTYMAGSMTGTATVVAVLSNSNSSFSYTPSSCGSYYFAVVSASSGTASCGVYRTASYASAGPVAVNSLSSAAISYAGSPWCTSSGVQPVLHSGSAGGAYSAPAGLSLDAATGAINPSLSLAGTYTVTYTLPPSGSCAAVTASASVTLTALPQASISYPGSPWCLSEGGIRLVSRTGTIGGTYSAGTGLAINSTTGAIDAAASSPGSYTVTYAFPASGGCPAVTTQAQAVLRADAGNPSVPSGSTIVCQGSNPLAFETLAENATGYTWSVTGAGNSISGTGTQGTVSWNPAFVGEAAVTVYALGCGGPKGPASVVFTVYPSGTWLGSTSNWNLPGNWCGGVPTLSSDITIPSGAINMPRINAPSYVNNLTLEAGAELTLTSGSSLEVNGQISGAGTLVSPVSATVLYSGSGDQTIFPASYGNLSTSGTGKKIWPAGATVKISGSFVSGAPENTVTGSTIEFSGTSAQVIPAFSFCHIQVSGGSVKSLGGNVTISGNAALNDGSLAIGSHTLNLAGTISGLGYLRGSAASSLSVTGPGSTGTLRFESGTGTLGNLTLNKIGDGDVHLGTPLVITGTLGLSRGRLVAGASNLQLVSGAGISGGGPLSYVQTNDQKSPEGVGFLIREVASGSGDVAFPVGTAQSYTPAYLNNRGASRDFRVRVFNMIFENGTSGDTILYLANTVQKTWEIEPYGAGGDPDVSVSLQWNAEDEGPGFPAARVRNQIYMGKNSGGPYGSWVSLITDASWLSGSPYTLTTSGITSFSSFAVGAAETPLSVRIGRLNVRITPRFHELTWQTFGEENSTHFEVEGSPDGRHFRTLGQVPVSGSTAAVRKYSYSAPATGKSAFYRIRMQGQNAGWWDYSNVASAGQEEGPAFQAGPNPVRDRLRVQLARADQKPAALRAFASDGRHVDLPVPDARPEGFDVAVGELRPGIYQLEIWLASGSTGRVRFIKN